MGPTGIFLRINDCKGLLHMTYTFYIDYVLILFSVLCYSNTQKVMLIR